MQEQVSRQYVGIDLHRRRSVIVRMDEAGKVLGTTRVLNDPVEFALAIAEAGEGPEVALEATYGYYWAADLLKDSGANVHLVHPLGLHWDSRRVKNDERDATELAKRLWRGDLPEAWVAPPEVRDLRELVRYRAKLVALRTSAKAQVHAVMAKCGVLPDLDDMFGPGGQVLLDKMELSQPYRYRVDSLRRLIEVFDDEIDVAESQVHKRLRTDRGYKAIQALNGVGRVTASIFVAEIGDITRFSSARHLCSWAGLTPLHRESDDKARRGHISKQGSTLVRWAAVEAVVRYHGGAPIAPAFRRVQQRRGTMIARVAAARRLLTLVYYGLRDGEIRCLRREAA
jgi:transposase